MRLFWSKAEEPPAPADALSVPQLVNILIQPAVDRLTATIVPAMVLLALIVGLVAGLVAGLLVAALT